MGIKKSAKDTARVNKIPVFDEQAFNRAASYIWKNWDRQRTELGLKLRRWRHY